MRKSWLILMAAALCGACAPEESLSLDDLTEVVDGKADFGSQPVDLSIGSRIRDLRVRSLAEAGDVTEAVVPLRVFLLAGQSACVVMTADDAELEPYLLVKERAGATIATSHESYASAYGTQADATVCWRANVGDFYYVFAAGGESLTSSGTFRVDAVDLLPELELPITIAIDGTIRVIGDLLRDAQKDLYLDLTTQALQEGADGLLARGPGFAETALASRPGIISRQAEINDLRSELFSAYSKVSGVSTIGVGEFFARYWSQIR